MKKKSVDQLLINQAKRRNTVFGLVCLIIIMFFISVACFLIYTDRNKAHYVTYDEDSTIDYKVYLNNNEFFDIDYLEANKQYIASLINHIDANFNYKLSLKEKDVEYKYTYRIEGTVNVKDKETSNSLFSETDILLEEKEFNATKTDVSISEDVIINYNQYNDLIKRFVSVYELDGVESTLTINMYVNVVGSCEDFVEDSGTESVMSLEIPLTTKTVAIDISNNLINTDNNVMQCKSINEFSGVYLVLGVLFTITSIGLVLYTIRYEIKTRTAENIYERELKKILNNYSSYIQKLNNDFNFRGYQLLKIDTFNDLLEIRDTIKQPILMKENDDKTGAYFVVPSSTKILYTYRLKVSDIKKKIGEELEEV